LSIGEVLRDVIEYRETTMRRCKRLFYYPAGKAKGVQIPYCQGIAVKFGGFTLGALALIPSGFCSVGVYVGW